MIELLQSIEAAEAGEEHIKHGRHHISGWHVGPAAEVSNTGDKLAKMQLLVCVAQQSLKHLSHLPVGHALPGKLGKLVN